MKENKNFKRLVTFAIAATMCMTGFAVLSTSSEVNAETDFLRMPISPLNRGSIPIPLNPGNIGTLSISNALVAGADYLKHAQADITEDNAGNGPDGSETPEDPDDGGWDWRLTSPAFTHSTAASSTNLYGVTALGLYYAYLETNDATYKIALDDAAGHMITDTTIDSAGDLIFLMLYDDLPSVGGTTYQDSAKAKYDARIGSYGSATAFAQWISTFRAGSGNENGIIPWDIGAFVRAAAMLDSRYTGYDTDADDMAEVVYQDSYMQNPGYFNLTTNKNNGWDPAYGNRDYYWYSLGITGLIDAFVYADVHTDKISSLVTTLLNCQYPSGAFSYCYGANTNDEDWQSAAYAVMTLAQYDQATYQININDAFCWIAATQDPSSGGWIYSSGNHYPEVGGECTSALYFANGPVKNLNTGEVFCTIQGAIDDSDTVNGHIIEVGDGTYYENVVVNKQLTLQAGSTPIIDGGGSGNGFTINSDGVTIDGFEITNCANGITSYGTDNSIVKNNIIHDNLNTGFAGVGIMFWSDVNDFDNNQILNNEIYNNDRQGIYIGGSYNDAIISNGNTISGNTIYNNGLNTLGNPPDNSAYGIQLSYADSNTISNNDIYGHIWDYTGSGYWFGQGIYLNNAYENTVTNNNGGLHDNNYGVVQYTDGGRTIGTNYVNYNNIFDNTEYGIRNYDSVEMDAECNWWGHCSGPSGEGPGSGDAVSTNVDFDPWIGLVVADAGGPYVSVDGSLVQFDSSGSTCYCESLLYLWDFGDGDTSTLENPTHTYTSIGGYTVTLTVEGSLTHCTDVDTTTVTVTSTVVSDAHGPYEGVVGIPIDFTGSASDGVPPYSYYWSFGDNVYSHDQNPSYKYKQPGTYTVSLKVTDDIDGQDTDSTYAIIHPPETLMADAGGPYSGGVGQVIAFTGNAVGGVSPYTFEWDLDNDGDYDDATGQSASKSWSTIGTYTIGLKVTDNIGTTDTDTAQVSITSHAPNKPSKPSGPTSGKAGTEYTYTSSTTDPDDDDVFYLFDWDDGTDSGWLGPYDSGDTVTASHTWTEEGDYQIKVKAKDEYDVESPWSDPLGVSMPKNKAINNPFLLFLERLIERFPILARLLQLPVFNRLLNLR